MAGCRSKLTLVGLLSRLWKDASGNTLAMVAAALVPMLAMVGGGIDMGRSYLSQSRLQQACDAGVLAARKRLGSEVVTTGIVPVEVSDVGNRFFNLNFRDGAYGTENRSFQMTLNSDYSIEGTASVDVPTTVMAVFGYSNVDIAVSCQARLNYSNTDIMFAVDTTGSMNIVDSGETKSRIGILRDTVKSFYDQIEASKAPGIRMRYGFVPFAENVNVGHLLKSDWLVDQWTYNSRRPYNTGSPQTYYTWSWNFVAISGQEVANPVYRSSTCPSDPDYQGDFLGRTTDADGQIFDRYFANGTSYWCNQIDGGQYDVYSWTYTDLTYEWRYLRTAHQSSFVWQYRKIPYDVSGIKNANGSLPPSSGTISATIGGNDPQNPQLLTANYYGCIEERSTYEIDDYDNVDLSRALDLDIDLVPTPADPDTQWRPMFHQLSYMPRIGSDSWTFEPDVDTYDSYYNTWDLGTSSCPAQARKLAEMSSSDLTGYLDSLQAYGSTYHDMGMIWAARLLSPTGLFASENADENGKPTSRHLIFLTDGETSALDVTYGAYGVEGLDNRRWSETSSMTLNQTVEARFGAACSEAKKRNITVWIIAFGTTVNPVMTECAGPGHYFSANNSAELSATFSKIASQIGDLRISR